jgi:hypothetical protein
MGAPTLNQALANQRWPRQLQHQCEFVGPWRDNHVLNFYNIYCCYNEHKNELLTETKTHSQFSSLLCIRWSLSSRALDNGNSSASVLSSPGVSFSSQSQSYVTTDGQSASLSWNKAPIWGLRQYLYYCQKVAVVLMWGDLSDEKTGLSVARVTVSSNTSVVSMYNLHFTGY